MDTQFADYMFNTAASGDTVGFVGAWAGVLAYSLQIYFDFSAYSDMAIGIAAMFGFRLPVNFNAPYKASDIRDFCRRWHITLSRFLREYLYFFLGGNRKGRARQLANLMITMLLGGLWHGAGWNFLLWGGLHGLYLVVHQAWQRMAIGVNGQPALPPFVGVALTSFVVILAWVPFRSADLSVTIDSYMQLMGAAGFSAGDWIANPILYGVPENLILSVLGEHGLSMVTSPVVLQYLLISAGFFIVWFAPTTTQIFEQ